MYWAIQGLKRNQNLDEVKERLRARLQNELEQKLANDIRLSLRKDKEITINESVLAGYQCDECAGKTP